jgi:hypothetical protein
MLFRITLKRSIAAAVLVFAAASSAMAEADAAAQERLARGVAAHNALNAAINGADPATAGAAADLKTKADEALRLLGPEGWDRPPLALAYHGSALTLEAAMAKREGKLMAALDLIGSGTKEIDQAMRLDPKGFETRVVRMENSLALLETSPSDRSAQAAEDIAYLRSIWADLVPEVKATVELDEGRLAIHQKRLSDALAAWRKATREAPGSEAAGRAKKLLARYGS